MNVRYKTVACLLSGLLLLPIAASADVFKSWESYGGDRGNTHYSILSEVNADNVGQLQLAWTYKSAKGKKIHSISELQVNPIIKEGVLYGRNPNHNIFAIKADTGEELWTFDPFAGEDGLMGSYMRGLTLWQSGDEQRLFSSAANYLLAIDPVTGKLINSFGDNGRVNLKVGLSRDSDKLSIYAPTPGVIYQDLIIMGSAVTEMVGAAPGDIRAYDVRTGDIVWTFHTIPHPGEFGYETWPEGAWEVAGGANAWAGLSVDATRGIVYIPTGSPASDFNGSDRHGANLFGNTILALDAKTGKRLWHFQTTHHDLWDRDLSSAPTLISVDHKGKKVDALVQASKQGVVYLLNRVTGEPLFPINEVAVPSSDVPGEKAWPTQPQVTTPEPFARQSLSEEDLTDINPKAHAHVKALFAKAVPFAYGRPPGLSPTLIFPGFYGGANYGGGAYDPDTNLYYINATEAPHLVHMVPVEVPEDNSAGYGSFVYKNSCSACHGVNREGFYPYAPSLVGVADRISIKQASEIIVQGKGRMMPFANLSHHDRQALLEYLFTADQQTKSSSKNSEVVKTRTEYIFGGYNDFVDDRWYPAVKPPWGTLNAINLSTGKRQWQVTLGEYEQLTKEGVPPTGTRNYGGPVVTKGGLIFIAASSDEKLRAFDKVTGKVLWEYKLPAGGYATPSVYEMNGKQYIVITCGGGKLGTKAGDQYLAFALPD